MRQARKRIGVGGVFSLILVFAVGAFAQEPALTARKTMLLEKVEHLKKRLAEVEQRLDAQAAVPPPQADLEQRVAKVEETSEKNGTHAPNDFRVYWNNGLRFETEDKRFKLRVGGRIQRDSEPGLGPPQGHCGA